MFVLTAMAFLQTASPAAAGAEASNEPLSAMSTQELAAKLLPPRVARRVAEHKFSAPGASNRVPAQVTFYTRPYPMPDGFCERDIYQVSTAAHSRVVQSADIRRGECPPAGAAGFAHVTPNPNLHVAQAKAAVRWLESAIAAARSDQALSFDVDCVAEPQPSLCAGGARAALAKLAVESAVTVEGAFTCRTSVTSFALRQESLGPGMDPGPVWHVRLARGTARPRVTLRGTAAPRS